MVRSFASHQPEGLPEGSRRSKQRGHLRSVGKRVRTPLGCQRASGKARGGNRYCGDATSCRREKSGTRFWCTVWHPAGVLLLCQPFPEVSATLRPPATFWHRFAVLGTDKKCPNSSPVRIRVGTARCAVSAAFSGAAIPPAAARAGHRSAMSLPVSWRELLGDVVGLLALMEGLGASERGMRFPSRFRPRRLSENASPTSLPGASQFLSSL